MTIHNDSAITALKERKELTDKKDAEIKKLNKRIGRLQFKIGMLMAFGLLCLVAITQKSPPPTNDPEPKITINRPIPFNSEYLLEPNRYIQGDFPLEERRRVTINVSVECQDCSDESLTIFLLDEDNYRMLDISQPYDKIDDVYSKSYLFTGSLNGGHYFVIIQNMSDGQDLVIKPKGNVSYIRDNLNFPGAVGFRQRYAENDQYWPFPASSVSSATGVHLISGGTASALPSMKRANQ
jgi:hypothetical protein